MSKVRESGIAHISVEEMTEAVHRSGYLVEQEAVRILAANGRYYVESNVGYLDNVTGKSREYDIFALSAFSFQDATGAKRFYAPALLCECKNNPEPILLFSRDEQDHALDPIQLVGSMAKVRRDAGSFTRLDSLCGFGEFHHYSQNQVASQWCSFQKKKDGTGAAQWMALHSDDQHDSIAALLDATENFMAATAKELSNAAPNFAPYAAVMQVMPTLILGGQLYTARLKEKGITIEKQDHALLRVQRASPGGIWAREYRVDVITVSYLAEHLETIAKESSAIVDRVKLKLKELESSEAWLSAQGVKIRGKPQAPKLYRT
jgi:hypothetical protein